MTTSPAAFLLDPNGIEAEFDHPREERRIDGNPRRATWNHYTNASGEVFAGTWSSEAGSWRIEMGEHEDEMFVVTSGRCRLVSDAGSAVECGVGQALLIPAGFRGRFEVIEALTKHYLIVDRRA